MASRRKNEEDPDSTVFEPGANVSADGGGVAIGSVLNHIYEVRRFIARGGMGAVYEGVNVNTDERVAIKVILPHLAADPKVKALFQKEGRALARLSHPALVQYRLLAMEPRLGVLYIVTEFVDGVGLDEIIGLTHPTDVELLALMRRLAEGLRVAHDLGAIHRDISPDNILLQRGRLETAKIIDFGIAKDLDASHATLVGDGFAGKLGFVAPEQFGDFSREVGPWTDVYSLGLVILSLAAGKPLDMGSTLVDAIERRRAGPVLSVVSPALQPLFRRMLTADPKLRLRSMGEVLAQIDAADLKAGGLQLRPRAAPKPPPAKKAPPARPSPLATPSRPAADRGSLAPLIVAAVVAAAAMIGVGAWLLAHHGGEAPAPVSDSPAPPMAKSPPPPVAATSPSVATPEPPTAATETPTPHRPVRTPRREDSDAQARKLPPKPPKPSPPAPIGCPDNIC